MSSIWTPGGERPVGRDEPPPGGDDEPTEAELQAQLEEMTRQLASTPASVVAANHAMGLFELAALHLSQQPPNLVEGSFAIDAMAALVEGMAGRWDENEATLRDALAQLRVAFVQIRAANLGATEPPPSSGPG